MFGDSAPIWGFLNKLAASNDLDPDSVVGATSGRFSFEIYPAAALVGLFPEFLERGKCAKYTPLAAGPSHWQTGFKFAG